LQAVHDGWGTWWTCWFFSLALIGVTIAIHATGIVVIGRRTVRWTLSPNRKNAKIIAGIPQTIGLIVAVAISLAILHGIESFAWAVVYVWLGAIAAPSDAVLYSIDSMTTRGSSGLNMETQWRMMGALESADGMLLFGISTAFLFTIMRRMARAFIFADDTPD
jgi:hypothetical protein